MNVAASTFKHFLAQSTGSVVAFVGTVVFARELDPERLGMFFLFQATIGMLGLVADLGLNGATTKRLSESEGPESILTTAILLKLVITLLLAFALVLAEPWTTEYFGANLTVFLVAGVLLQTGATFAVSVIEGELRVDQTAFPEAAKQLVWVVAGAILLHLGYGVPGVITGLLLGFVAMGMLAWRHRSTEFGRPGWSEARSLARYAGFAAITSVGGYVYNWLDIALIGYFLTRSDVGVYEVAWKVSVVVLIMSRALARSLFPVVSRLIEENRTREIEALIPKAMTVSLYLVIPACVGALLLGEEVLQVVFGPEYSESALVLVVLVAATVPEALQQVVGRTLLGLDRPELAARATGVAVLLNVVLNLLLIPSIGLIGAALATTVASLVGGFGLHVYYLSRHIRLLFPIKDIGWCLVAVFVMAAVVVGVTKFVDAGRWPGLATTLMLAAITYVATTSANRNLRSLLARLISGLWPADSSTDTPCA